MALTSHLGYHRFKVQRRQHFARRKSRRAVLHCPTAAAFLLPLTSFAVKDLLLLDAC